MKTRYERILEHHGVKGQKWGVRRYRNEDGSLTPEGQRRVDKDVRKGWSKAYNKAADTANRKIIPELNRKYAKYDFRDRNVNSEIRKKYNEYVHEYATQFNKVYSQNVKDLFGGLPSYGMDGLPGWINEKDYR